jgi:MFS family permease
VRNVRLLIAFAACRQTLFPIPVITLFWRHELGMSLADVMLLQAIFALAATVCEVPSGYVADRIGYRGSLLFAAWLWFAGWILYVLAGSFAGAVVAELALGTAIAFASGADSALLWVALERAGRAGEYTRWEGRLQAAAQTAESLSAVCGGYLYAVAPAPVALLAPAPVGVARARGRPPHTRGTADERRGRRWPPTSPAAARPRAPGTLSTRAAADDHWPQHRARPVELRAGVADPAVHGRARRADRVVPADLGCREPVGRGRGAGEPRRR